jgi:hypothetical protein
MENDPVGFIKVINGNVTEFDIYVDYSSYRPLLGVGNLR